MQTIPKPPNGWGYVMVDGSTLFGNDLNDLVIRLHQHTLKTTGNSSLAFAKRRVRDQLCARHPDWAAATNFATHIALPKPGTVSSYKHSYGCVFCGGRK
jgi:hypothetical protein